MLPVFKILSEGVVRAGSAWQTSHRNGILSHLKPVNRVMSFSGALLSTLLLTSQLHAETGSAEENGRWNALMARVGTEQSIQGGSSLETDSSGAALRPRIAPTNIRYERAWIDQQPVRRGGRQWHCLTEALYFEARGETVRGQFAVAEVILNRVSSNRFPDTVCGVVNQGTGKRYQCQFTYTCDGHPEVVAERRAWERVGKVAALMLDGAPRRLTNGATYYHTTAVKPSWSNVFERTAHIGVHLFYRDPTIISSN